MSAADGGREPVADSTRAGGAPAEDATRPAYTAVIATFRRPRSLEEVLRDLQEQSHPPGLVVVVDNDPARSAQTVAARTDGTPCHYLPADENLGPAGGWARGVRHAATAQNRGDWVVTLDDDDPAPSPDTLRRHLQFAARQPEDVAGVGLRGAMLDRTSMRLRRATGHGRPVDYLAGGGLPAYRWATIERCGFVDARLWFGFEDLEYGLRLQRDGAKLILHDDPDLRVADTSPARTPWREYYKTRALIHIARTHVGVGPAMYASARAVSGSARLRLLGHTGVVRARRLGVIDGWQSRLGRLRYDPAENPAKQDASSNPEHDD